MFLLICIALPEERDVISVNYVSPLVLRKELENLMDNEGVGALESPDIIRERQVIFWNIVSLMKTYILREIYIITTSGLIQSYNCPKKSLSPREKIVNLMLSSDVTLTRKCQ